MTETYNNPLNMEIINMTNSWSGQIGIYADGYATKADRKAKKNFDPQSDRRRMALSYTDSNGEVQAIPKDKWSNYIKRTKDITDSVAAAKQIRFLARQDFGNNINFAKPFAHFDDRITGIRAGMRLLMGNGYLTANPPRNTVDLIVHKFAPKFENNTQSYIDSVMGKFKKVKGYEKFNGVITKKEIPMLFKFMLQHENDKKSGLHEYYINDKALKNDWPVAEWCARENRPQSYTASKCKQGYKMFTSTKNQTKEDEYNVADDGSDVSGGTTYKQKLEVKDQNQKIHDAFKDEIKKQASRPMRY